MDRRQFLAGAAPFALFGGSSSAVSSGSMELFMGPIIDRLAEDDKFRKRYLDYARERLGETRFKEVMYKMMLDAMPHLRSRPVIMRMMRRAMSGGGRRRLFRRWR